MRARLVKIEGLDKPCLVVCGEHGLPDELVIDFRGTHEHWAEQREGPVTFRLQPSTTDDPEPVYVEMFDD
ncbi:MAG: hypothetical protein IPM29_23570 [Planctomycetes bacterium]|nr:hypothetical protein [Planctomycetota bacterium]